MRTITNFDTLYNSTSRIMEHKLVINGVDYFNSDISSFTINHDLFDKFGIGNATAKVLKFSVIPKSIIPKMAVISTYFRLVDGATTTEWIAMGEYLIDTRAKNNIFVDFTAMDRMLMFRKYLSPGWNHAG